MPEWLDLRSGAVAIVISGTLVLGTASPSFALSQGMPGPQIYTPPPVIRPTPHHYTSPPGWHGHHGQGYRGHGHHRLARGRIGR
jgi:hypothetical protein